jgi:hypothetical protein
MGNVRDRATNRNVSVKTKSASAPARIASTGSSSSVSWSVWTLLRTGLAWNGERIADAYAAAARVVQERKEALEDLNAERNNRRRHLVSGNSLTDSPASLSGSDKSE